MYRFLALRNMRFDGDAFRLSWLDVALVCFEESFWHKGRSATREFRQIWNFRIILNIYETVKEIEKKANSKFYGFHYLAIW